MNLHQLNTEVLVKEPQGPGTAAIRETVMRNRRIHESAESPWQETKGMLPNTYQTNKKNILQMKSSQLLYLEL
jgi:hypothetical protein